MDPVVVGIEGELAFRPDHPHPMADRELPQEWRELAALDEPDVHLVALVAGYARVGRNGIGSLDDPRRKPSLALREDPDRHVLAGLEGRRVAVEPNEERGQRLGVVDPPDEAGVVALVVRDDHGLGDFDHQPRWYRALARRPRATLPRGGAAGRRPAASPGTAGTIA